MEGPRAVGEHEMESLRALTGTVFRTTMFEEYPQLFNADNLENLRVCLDDAGRCVSHVGMKQQDASLYGCRIRTACIGAVSTDPAYRKQGLASACFDDAAEKAYRDGVDIMIVSGNRNLYRMRGCRVVGSDLGFEWTEATPAPEDGLLIGNVTAAPMNPDELGLIMACYRREPVRFMRSPEEYHYALQSGRVMDRLGRFWTIRERGAFRGYVILHTAKESGRAGLAEFAGDRRALLSALPEIMRTQGLTSLRWQVMRYDDAFRTLCEQAGLEGKPMATPGTVKLIHFTQLMERLRPYWKEVLGPRDAARLSFAQQGDEYRFRFDTHELVADRDTTTQLLFGTLKGEERQELAGPDALTQTLQQILPLPCLWYGLNYV